MPPTSTRFSVALSSHHRREVDCWAALALAAALAPVNAAEKRPVAICRATGLLATCGAANKGGHGVGGHGVGGHGVV